MGYVNANPRDDSGQSVIAPIRLGAVRQLLGQSTVAACGLPFYPDKQTYLETHPKFAHGRVEDGHAPHPIGDQNIEEGIARRPMQERAITPFA